MIRDTLIEEEECPHCFGSGIDPDESWWPENCPVCNGIGVALVDYQKENVE